MNNNLTSLGYQALTPDYGYYLAKLPQNLFDELKNSINRIFVSIPLNEYFSLINPNVNLSKTNLFINSNIAKITSDTTNEIFSTVGVTSPKLVRITVFI